MESAIQQTFKEIEIIVVGDGCTDDSEAVVTAVNDPRVHWLSLNINSGSQAFPNNKGIDYARGEFIAYLGHDDLWHPTHLQRLLAVQEETQADFIYSGAICYGPPGTEIRMVTGFSVANKPLAGHFVPPSTVMHRTSLAYKIGKWRSHLEVEFPVDYDFQLRGTVGPNSLIH